MQNKWVRVYIYQLSTPKLNTENNAYDDQRFDQEHLVSFIRKIMDQPLENRIFDTGDKVITLEKFNISDDADFLEGNFTSARYGEVPNLVHSRTFQKRPSDKTMDEGDENNIYFVIERATGRLFLQSDGKRLVTRNSIDKYLRNFTTLFENDIAQLNRMIQPLMITPRNLFSIKTIFAESFFGD